LLSHRKTAVAPELSHKQQKYFNKLTCHLTFEITATVLCYASVVNKNIDYDL